MIESTEDYADSTGLERYMIDSFRPLGTSGVGGEIDLRKWQKDGDPVVLGIVSHASTSERGKAQLRSAAMPFLFGAAWKIIDLLLELSMCRAAIKQDKKEGWTIAAKVKAATDGSGEKTILTNDAAVWAALCRVYAATSEHRHCLVHRMATFNDHAGELSGLDKYGVALKPLTKDEIDAFVVAAQVASAAVIGGGLKQRESEHLRYELDRLRGHTGSTPLGGVRTGAPNRVLATLRSRSDGKFEADLGALLGRAKQAVQQGHFDFCFEVPNRAGQQLYGSAENFPDTTVIVDLDNLPPYLQFG